MSEYALRKSVGSLSAGTRVFVMEQPEKTRSEYTVHTHFAKVGTEFNVPANDLVELRPRTSVGPLKNRRARRAENAKAQQILQNLANRVRTGGLNDN